MSEWIFLIIGILAGGAVGWFISRAATEKRCSSELTGAANRAASAEAREGELRKRLELSDNELKVIRDTLQNERTSRTQAEAELKASLENLREQKTLLDVMKKEMSDTFTSLASAALKSSNEDFLRLARENIGKVVAETHGKLGEHKAAMDGMFKPLKEALSQYEGHIKALESKRREDYASLDQQIKLLATTHRDLQKETGNLVTALRKPHVRGRWGEVTLRNVVELAGMSNHCDFTEQVSMNTDEGRLRPDMIIRLPGGHAIVVDSKVSMEALLDLSSAQTEEDRRAHMQRHARHIKEQIIRLSSKAYWQHIERSTELAVLFMGEQALVAALELEPTLFEDSMSKKVLLATPTTLLALLRSVAYGWRQEQLTENAEQIAILGRELYERVRKWTEHLARVGAALGKSVEAYNNAMGSMEARVLPTLRKFRELGASSAEEVPPPHQVEQAPRNLSLIE